MQAGQLKDRVTFSVRASTGDEYGNPTTGGFVDQFTVYARVQYLRGSEPVVAARLQGVQPVVVTVRRTPETDQIKADWRIVDVNDASRVFNIRSVTPGDDRDLIDLLCEAGVAV